MRKGWYTTKKEQKTQAKRTRPATTPEAREEILISLAEDNAERMLRDGTASSQLVTTLLKQGSRQAKVELELAELQKQLTEAKTESLRQSRHLEEKFTDAVKAMKMYQGMAEEDE